VGGETLVNKNPIEVEHLGLGDVPDAPAAERPLSQDGDLTLETMERKHITRALDLLGGNKRQAAKRLGISRSTLDRKLKRLGIELA